MAKKCLIFLLAFERIFTRVVRVELDPELATNTRKWEADTFYQRLWEAGAAVRKGEYFGEFNLGSTIVLIFEAPRDF